MVAVSRALHRGQGRDREDGLRLVGGMVTARVAGIWSTVGWSTESARSGRALGRVEG